MKVAASNRSLKGNTAPGELEQAAQHLQPEASGSKSHTSMLTSNGRQNTLVTGAPSGNMFEEGQDFISFGLEDASDEESNVKVVPKDELVDDSQREPTKRDKGKGKMRESSSSRANSPPRSEEKELNRRDRRERERRSDRDRSRERDRDGDRDRRRGTSRDRDGGRRGPDRGRVGDDEPRVGTRRGRDFDPSDGYANKKQRIDASSRKSPWLADVNWGRSRHVAEILHKEVEGFVNYISPSAIEHEVRGFIIALIRRTVVSSFPDASVFPFGSYETKLYLPLGDIDLVIMSQSMAYNDKITVLHALANAIKRARITERVSIIAKAKVPIVKFVTTHGRFNVDISVNQENGIISGGIINGFLKSMHDGDSLALRSLVMVTKAFLSQRSMNEVYSGGLGSYSIVCLAISFLQMHPKIRRGEIDANLNLGVLLMEFFELYGCYFNYSEVGISVRDGGTYFSKKQRGWYNQYKENILSIEDPVDPSNDISKGSFAFPKVRTTFAGAYGILTSAAYNVAGILESRRSGRAVHLRDHDDPGELSILSSVMGVTQETINHRKLVQELYDKGILQNALGIEQRARVPASSAATPGVVVNGAKRPSSGSARAKNTEESHDSEEVEEVDVPHKRQHEEEEDEGRYAIGRQPSRKRRRTNYSRTVFTTDDEEEEERDSLAGEEAHYASDVESRPRSTRKNDKRRSYWLSKGIGMTEGD